MKAKDLKNSILQMAVQGKLVPQDPSDEPASVLLERIRTERAQLIKEKKIKAPKGGESMIYLGSDGSRYEKRSKGEPVCIDDEIPFDIPEGWEWARLEGITTYIQRGKSPKYSLEKKYPVVAQKCNQCAYCAVFATPFHAPLLQRSMADCHVAMRVALIARGAQAPLLANTAGYALSRCACALTRRLQYG